MDRTKTLDRAEAMKTRPVWKLMLLFSLPSILGMMVNALYNIVDRVFVGHVVGADGLGAITVIYPIATFVSALGSLFGVGSASQMARCLGMGRRDQASKVWGNSVTVCLISGVPLIILSWIFMEPLVRACGGTDALMSQSLEYYRIVLPGLLIQLTVTVLCADIRAEGSPACAMAALIVGAAGNVFLDWLFIVRFRWGVAGAGWGTLLAQILSLLWCAAYYRRGQSPLSLSLASLKPEKRILAETLGVGIAPFLVNLSYALVLVVFNHLLGRMGGELAIASAGIFCTVNSLLFMPVGGMGEGLIPLIGYNYGAGRIDRIRLAAKLAIGWGLFFFISAAALAWFCPGPMVRLFNTDNPELAAMGARALGLGCLGMPISGMTFPVGYILQGLGKARNGLILFMFRQLAYIPALLILPRLFGMDGVWLCFPAMEYTGGILAALMIRQEFRLWRELEKQPPSP